jgi:hypothetical protein
MAARRVALVLLLVAGAALAPPAAPRAAARTLPARSPLRPSSASSPCSGIRVVGSRSDTRANAVHVLWELEAGDRLR